MNDVFDEVVWPLDVGAHCIEFDHFKQVYTTYQHGKRAPIASSRTESFTMVATPLVAVSIGQRAGKAMQRVKYSKLDVAVF